MLMMTNLPQLGVIVPMNLIADRQQTLQETVSKLSIPEISYLLQNSLPRVSCVKV